MISSSISLEDVVNDSGLWVRDTAGRMRRGPVMLQLLAHSDGCSRSAFSGLKEIDVIEIWIVRSPLQKFFRQ